jgi:hypothetical protein
MAILTEVVVTTRGLCSACRYEAGCIYPRSKEEVVLNCGQFEPCLPLAQPPPSPDQVELEKLWRKSSREESDTKFKGLCSSCEDRNVCIYPKPAGGVWRCEEYR